MFHTILADPPWLERGGGKIKRGADRHYPLLKTPEILEVMTSAPVWYPAESCHLYLWVTNNFLPDGLWLVEQLGFDYKTVLTWGKDRMGLGYYFRGQTEQLLFASKGLILKPRVKTKSTLMLEARREHSQKPELAYEVIEAVSHAPYLEMFCRQPREGWYSWGDEI